MMKIIMKIMFHLFRKIVLKVKLIKYPSSGKNPLLVEDVLMQQIQANFQLVQKKTAEIIPALLEFGSSL